MTTRENVNVQSHQEGSKLNSTIKANSAYTLAHDKIKKITFNKNNVATIKNKNLTKILLLGSVANSYNGADVMFLCHLSLLTGSL